MTRSAVILGVGAMALLLGCTSGEGVPVEGEEQAPAPKLEPAPKPEPADEVDAVDCDGHAVGEHWKSDCNDCVCTEAGQTVCSRTYCGGLPTGVLGKDSPTR